MYNKIEKREYLSKQIAQFFPPLQVQLAMNDIANTSLTHQVQFLNATTVFHEDLRLGFYPKIFDNDAVSSVNWKSYKPKFFKFNNEFTIIKNSMYLIVTILVLIGFGFLKYFKTMKRIYI